MTAQQLLLHLAPAPAPTLDNFVAGRNGAALAALRALAAGGGSERCIYLWGEAGSGRTHLLRAALATAGTRGRWFASAAQAAGAEREAIVAADDVQLLGAEQQSQLFDLYNRLRAAGGALIASGDASPAQLALRADLRTRLAAGLAYQLHPLSDAEKAAALRAQAQARGMNLPDEIIAYLLRHVQRDMPSLIAILDALDRYSLQTHRAPSLPLLREALRGSRET